MPQIKDVMTKNVKLINPTDTLQVAAQAMREQGCGILPVQEDDQLIGMITDRDIVIRCLAQGDGPDAEVGDAMTEEVKYCYEDDELAAICQNMAENQLRRLPVMNKDKRLVGIVSLSDLSKQEPQGAGQALSEITKPNGQYHT